MQVGYVLLQIILLGQGGTRNPRVYCIKRRVTKIVQLKINLKFDIQI